MNIELVCKQFATVLRERGTIKPHDPEWLMLRDAFVEAGDDDMVRYFDERLGRLKWYDSGVGFWGRSDLSASPPSEYGRAIDHLTYLLNGKPT